MGVREFRSWGQMLLLSFSGQRRWKGQSHTLWSVCSTYGETHTYRGVCIYREICIYRYLPIYRSVSSTHTHTHIYIYIYICMYIYIYITNPQCVFPPDPLGIPSLFGINAGIICAFKFQWVPKSPNMHPDSPKISPRGSTRGQTEGNSNHISQPGRPSQGRAGGFLL